MEFVRDWWDALWDLLFESGLWLIVGFAMAGALHALLPKGFLEKHLAGRGPWPILKASLMGIPLPLCSCSVIPVAAELRRGGASRGSAAAFAISTPQTGEESIPLTWALFGPVYALIRPVVAVVTAFVAGVLIEAFAKAPRAEHLPADDAGVRPDHTSDTHASSCGHGGQACSEAEGGDARSLGERIRAGVKHGFVTMPLDLAPWLTVGFVLAAGVTALVPAGWIASNVGTGLVPMLLMLLVGIPLYICATSSTPLAFSLVAAGLSPGAALVLLLAGPATNVATITWAIKDLGVRATLIYLGSIAGVSLAAGWVFDAFLTRFVHLSETAGMMEHMGGSPIYAAGAIIFVMLLGWAMSVRVAQFVSRLSRGDDARACHAH